jgi:predicted transcriptional regulator
MNEETEFQFVKRCLTERSQSVRAIAEESGVPYDTICKVLQAQVSNPRVQTIEKLAKYFRGTANTSNHVAASNEHAPEQPVDTTTLDLFAKPADGKNAQEAA